jgi:putative serine protease PepD
VIKVDQSSLPTISMGNSDSVKVGNPVVVLGAPLGLSSTVTNGIVSALDRTIEVPGESASQSALLVDAIQTDAAINPGNSGGAMTNCSGQLIGIPSAGATVPTEGGGSSAGSIGLGFAIPVNLAKTVSDELISTGTATHSFFGLSAQPVTDNGTLTGQVKGLLVSAVVPGGPSADAGLRAGDLITSIDGKPATDTTQLEAITLSKRPGDTVNLEYERNGEKSTATVTLGQLPTSST